jgi:esterase/lipase
VRRLLIVVGAALLWAAPAQALTKQSGTRTMSDGTSIAYDLYQPGGAVPHGGWPGVVVLHGLGGSKDEVAPVAQILAAQGYAALAYSDRGSGTSTGDLELAGPKETSDERAMESFFAGLPQVSDSKIGAWGISYGGGQVWNGLVAGIPYRAAEVVETWTDLYSALWPGDIARSGILAGFARAVAARSPLIAQLQTDAVQSSNLPAIKAIAAQRSSVTKLAGVKTPAYMFQGRVDYAFDVSQALNGYTRVRGPKHLYVGQFGHPPSTFPGPDYAYVLAQGLAWYDHYLKGLPNGIDRSKPVTIAAATGNKRVSYAGVPPTKNVGVGFRGTSLLRTGPRFQSSLETFGVSIVKVQVRKLHNYPRLVAVVLAGNRVITHGAIKPKVGLQTIRLANYVQYLPKGTRLTVRFGRDGGPDPAYLGLGGQGSIALGPAFLTLHTLRRPVSG